MSNNSAQTRAVACSLCERDIDLMLLQEFYCSSEFRAWFLGRVTGKSGDSLNFDAKHSVAQTLGETDLEIWFSDEKGTRWAVLIENKIAADFQEKQPERYQLRAKNYEETNAAGHAITVLLAPAGYEKEGCALFNNRLSYEEICDWLAKRDDDVCAKYKAELLTAAIKKALDKYKCVPDLPVSDFWHEYWNIAQRQAPQLRMRKPKLKGGRAGFIRFYPLELPSGVQLIHKIPLDCVDLQFDGFGRRLQELQQKFGAALERNMSIQDATKSGAIRILVPNVNPKLPFKSQEQKVLAAISVAEELLEWFRVFAQLHSAAMYGVSE
jgi:hypothetical protein